MSMKKLRRICAIIGAIVFGLIGVVNGYTAGSELAPKVRKAKKIWDELKKDDPEESEG